MYHCDACGWDGAEPVLSDEPISKGLLWTLRGCPTCGEEVYETTVVRGAHLLLRVSAGTSRPVSRGVPAMRSPDDPATLVWTTGSPRTHAADPRARRSPSATFALFMVPNADRATGTR